MLYSDLKIVDFVSNEGENKEQFQIDAGKQESVGNIFSSVDRSVVETNQAILPDYCIFAYYKY